MVKSVNSVYFQYYQIYRRTFCLTSKNDSLLERNRLGQVKLTIWLKENSV